MFLTIYRVPFCLNIYKRNITYCNLNAKKDGHIYVVKEREFIKTNENIYKIGRSKNIVRRMPAYPKDSLIYSIMYSQNVVESEKALITHFDTLFKKRTDIGYEYYEADENELMMECTMFIHNLYK
jgi:hypothetical protein